MDNTRTDHGLTLIELIVCTVIIGILSTTALPIAKNFIRREKEVLLQERLAEIRYAIDRYYAVKSASEPALADHLYYPQTLEDLVEKKLLRKIPLDPFTEKPDWKTRSSTDELQSQNSNMVNVFDVYSACELGDLKGVPYSAW